MPEAQIWMDTGTGFLTRIPGSSLPRCLGAGNFGDVLFQANSGVGVDFLCSVSTELFLSSRGQRINRFDDVGTCLGPRLHGLHKAALPVLYWVHETVIMFSRIDESRNLQAGVTNQHTLVQTSFRCRLRALSNL